MVDELQLCVYGKIFCVIVGVFGWLFVDWVDCEIQVVFGFVMWLGVFFVDGFDFGLVVLLQYLLEKLFLCMVDLGVGWGWLLVEVLKYFGIGMLYLVEVDVLVLDCVCCNVIDLCVQFYWVDVCDFCLFELVNGVIMNLLFYQGCIVDFKLGVVFICVVVGFLIGVGWLWMVVNWYLFYEVVLCDYFGDVLELGGDNCFKILMVIGVCRNVVWLGVVKGCCR